MRILSNDNKPVRVKTEKAMPDGSKEKNISSLFFSAFPDEVFEEEEEQPLKKDVSVYDLELRDYLDNYIAREKAKSDYSMLSYGDTVAQVESMNDPRAKQIGGGPGRGKYQFEPAAAITASNRLAQLSEALNFDNPSWNTLENMRDVSKLSSEQQDILFLADKLQDENTDLEALSKGEISGEDFWINHHWKGNASGTNDAEEAQRRMHYRSTVNWMNQGEE